MQRNKEKSNRTKKKEINVQKIDITIKKLNKDICIYQTQKKMHDNTDKTKKMEIANRNF